MAAASKRGTHCFRSLRRRPRDRFTTVVSTEARRVSLAASITRSNAAPLPYRWHHRRACGRVRLLDARLEREVTTMFLPGREYRRDDIHRLLGGQRQNGIVTPRGRRVVLLFASPRGETDGYQDGWSEDGRFYRYTGEGQYGDMRLTRGNRAVLEHPRAGACVAPLRADTPGTVPLRGTDGMRWLRTPSRCPRSLGPTTHRHRLPVATGFFHGEGCVSAERAAGCLDFG